MDQPGAILVTCIVPCQSYWMFSFWVPSQWLNYFKDQCVFVQSLRWNQLAGKMSYWWIC